MPDTEDPGCGPTEAMNCTAKAREASAYAAGAAKASWEALIKAADQAREAAEAWRIAEEADAIQAKANLTDDPEDAVSMAEATVASALPRETRRRLEQQAHTAALRSAEAREIAEFTGNLALQAAREWGEAERAWQEIRDDLAESPTSNDDRSGDFERGEKIEITANGSAYSIDPGLTVASFIESRSLPVESCIAELNGVALTRAELASTTLNEGDSLEIVRAVAGGCAAEMTRREALEKASLYFICSAQEPDSDICATASQAIAGGASIVQLREHEASDRRILEAAKRLRDLTAEAGALFLVNDRPDIALAASADGVHVGQDDLAPRVVRDLVGSELLIGLSTHSEHEIEAAQDSGADYIGVGPVYATPTKKGRPGTGLSLVSYAAQISSLPFFAIGGIDVELAAFVAEAGATRIAVVRAIESAPDPGAAASALVAALRPDKFATR
ncbi:MAG: hypothetical protein DCC49_09545 [Acidobacteria bacterium]|nr:MAG: hypothetical protein DCC49_09545 [Acidobacteriota bacterium]